jgi:hypothetical protein
VTKLFSAAAPSLAVQGSDRLVSAGGQPFDPRANKTIVYVSRDGVMFVSYTGSSYVEQLPTDEWLVRELTGVDEVVPPAPGSYGGAATWTAARIGALPEWLSVSDAAARLATSLDTAATLRAADEEPISLHVAGLRWNRDDPRAATTCFVGVVKPTSHGYAAFLPPLPRSGQDFEFGEWPDSTLYTGSYMEDVSRELGETFPDAAAWEDTIVQAIRHASQQTPTTIGPNCITASVAASGLDVIRIRFHSIRSHGEMVRRNSTGRPQTVKVAYTPWLVAQNYAAPPFAVTGWGEFDLGPVEVAPTFSTRFRAVIIDPPAGSNGLIAATATPHRKKNPRKQARRKKK